jgi:hypothetical protein
VYLHRKRDRKEIPEELRKKVWKEFLHRRRDTEAEPAGQAEEMEN